MDGNVLHKIYSIEVFDLNEQHSMFYVARKVIHLKKGKEFFSRGQILPLNIKI